MARNRKSKTNESLEATDLGRHLESAENSLGPSQPIEKAASKRARGSKVERPRSDAATDRRDTVRTAKEGQESHTIPRSIRERFIGVGSEYYFPDGAVAFKDHGMRLTTPSENTEVIRSMVEIAQARDWNDITVRGTERFRKESWFVASLAGMEVKGYEPTQFERQRMIRAIARRDGYSQELASKNDVARRGDGAPSRDGRQSADSHGREAYTSDVADRARPDGRAAAAPASRNADSAAFTGRLVDHGAAPYHHDRAEPMSYFVRLETPSGDKEIWGVDLERAINKSLTRPTMGDQVTVRAAGRDPVTVLVEKHDEKGRVAGTEEVQTYRNRWAVEKAEFMAARAAAAKVFRDPEIRPEDGVKRHPELNGTYLQLQVAKDLAQREITESGDRQRFVERTREALAQAIEAGEPLQPIQMRDRGGQRGERQKAPERNVERTR